MKSLCHSLPCHQILPVRAKKKGRVSAAQLHRFVRFADSRLIEVLHSERVTLMQACGFCHTKVDVTSLVGMVPLCRTASVY